MNVPKTSSLLARRWTLSTGQLVALVGGVILLSAGCTSIAQRSPVLTFQNAAVNMMLKKGGAFQCTGDVAPASSCTVRVGVNLRAQVGGELKKSDRLMLCGLNEEVKLNEETQSMQCVPIRYDEKR